MYVPNWDAIIALLIPNLIGMACGLPLRGQLSNKDGTAWYQTIKKPSWILADWVFGPVVAFAYTGLGYASYLVYKDSSGFVDNSQLLPVLLYAAHLFLGLAACVTLYRFHKFQYAMILVFALDFVQLALSLNFYEINQYTALFLIPIQAYTLYNTLLSHALWILNRKTVDEPLKV